MCKRIIGYARVSTKFQSLKWQIEALQSYAEQNGCEIEIFSEIVSGAQRSHCITQPICKAVDKAKEEGLPIVVTALDRLSRRVDVGMQIYEEVPQVISMTEGELTREEAREIFAQAEREHNKICNRTKVALEAWKYKRLKERKEWYRNIYETEGAFEYVFHYVDGEIFDDQRTKMANWTEGDILSCIYTAWDEVDIVNYASPTLEEATAVAELALTFLSKKKSRMRCAVLHPIDGWVFNGLYQEESNLIPNN